MIRYSDGDIFAAGCEALVNPVNCLGVMGAGLALEVRRRFRDACGPYIEACQQGALMPGGVVIAHRDAGNPPRYVLHVATKMHWRVVSRLSWVGQGLDGVAGIARTMRLRSVAVPALGCGRGGLEWKHVQHQIEAYLGEVEEVEWIVFPPQKGL